MRNYFFLKNKKGGEIIKILLSLVFVCILFISEVSAADKHYESMTMRFHAGIQQASQMYNLPSHLFYVIAKVESNFNFKAINKNRNKTYDLGVFQINTSNLKRFNLPYDVAFDPYYAALVAGYILNECFEQFGNSWSAIDCYNKGGRRAKNSSRYVHNFYNAWEKLFKLQAF